MKYITRDGKAFELQEHQWDITPLVVGCAIAVGVGLGLRYVAESYPDLVVNVFSTFGDVAAAVWGMVCDIVELCCRIFR